MLSAILHGKSGTAEDGTSWRRTFRGSEDLLTAAVWTRVSYLPSALIRELLMSTFPALEELLNAAGEFDRIEFWPRLPAVEASGGRHVEPDALLHFEKLHVIVEAKRDDSELQKLVQWESEIAAYRESHPPGELVALIAIGGLGDVREAALLAPRRQADVAAASVPVGATSWANLMGEVAKLAGSPGVPGHCRRILDDVLRAMELHGFWQRTYLGEFRDRRYPISPESWTVFRPVPPQSVPGSSPSRPPTRT